MAYSGLLVRPAGRRGGLLAGDGFIDASSSQRRLSSSERRDSLGWALFSATSSARLASSCAVGSPGFGSCRSFLPFVREARHWRLGVLVDPAVELGGRDQHLSPDADHSQVRLNVLSKVVSPMPSDFAASARVYAKRSISHLCPFP